MNKKAEIMPVGQNLMVLVHDKNPYMTNTTEEGFQTTDGEFINEDSGDKDSMRLDVVCGQVIEIGHKCEVVQPGDDVIFNIKISRPVPFMDKGFILVPESQVYAIIGVDIKSRTYGG